MRSPICAGFAVDLSGDPTGLPGEPVWDDLPTVRLYGRWRADEVIRIHAGPDRLLVFGHCLAGTSRIEEEFRAALGRGDLIALSSWPGAYALLALNAEKISAFTDFAGQFPIFYAYDGHRGTLASHADIAAERQGGRRPDIVSMAAYIACPSVLPIWETRSPYEGTRRLAGGRILRADRRGVRIDRGGLSIDAEERVGRESGAPGLRSALVESVAARCRRTRVTADLSGGLDSTSLVYLAARAAEKPIETVTYQHPDLPTGDLTEAMRFARLDERIRPTIARGSDTTLPYAALAEHWPYPEPATGLLSRHRSLLRLRHVAVAGEDRIHLTGEGGDAVCGASPDYLPDLWRHAPLAHVLWHCTRQARRKNLSPIALAMRTRRLASRPLGTSLTGMARSLTEPTDGSATWLDAVDGWSVHGSVARLLTRGVRRRLAEIASDESTLRAIPPGLGAADVVSLGELRQSADTQRFLRELGYEVNVRVHAPYLDDAVVRAGLIVRPAFRRDVHREKPLLMEALRGIVPDVVFDRSLKGDYSGEEYRGARQAAGMLGSLMDESALAETGVVDPGEVRTALSRLLAGLPSPLGALGRFFATEMWLRDGAT